MAATSEQKRAAIKNTLLETKERRKSQICKVYRLKIDQSRLSKHTLESLHRLFVEAKWFRNAILASEDVYGFDTTVKAVSVKVGDAFEIRPLMVIGSQIKQSVLDQIKSEIGGLSTQKKQGQKVGALKFKSWVGSVNLKQHGTTYTLHSNGRLRIQNIKQNLRTRGIDQIPDGAEFANAKLLHKHGDFYLHLTCFLTAQQLQEHRAKKKPKLDVLEKVDAVGLDMGIANQVTTSNGIQIQYRVPCGEQIKKKHRKVSQTKKGSKNRAKARQQLQKAYAHTTNIKQNIQNQLVALFCVVTKQLVVQNDYVKGWQRIWGKRLFETSIGGLLSKLKKLPNTVVVKRWFASSQICRRCHQKTKHELKERVFVCGFCGHREPRDVHSAKNILHQGLCQKIGAEYTESGDSTNVLPPTPADIKTAALMLEFLNQIPHVQACLMVETGSPSL